ncbi:hypothetical protein V493_01037 [Pseudogymnoascus sp. VKM F-4281 (FW-2241)]|nr:hypothetical protein V493_01037 [Pseudogymnoascus sp. VKM F-4281 (FW-2241)]
MAITELEIKSTDQPELKRNVLERVPTKAGTAALVEQVKKKKFVGATAGSWRVCKEGTQDETVTPSCLVYIVVGKCKVGGEILSQPTIGDARVGYLVTGETLIQLQSETIVIFFQYSVDT